MTRTDHDADRSQIEDGAIFRLENRDRAVVLDRTAVVVGPRRTAAVEARREIEQQPGPGRITLWMVVGFAARRSTTECEANAASTLPAPSRQSTITHPALNARRATKTVSTVRNGSTIGIRKL